MYFGNNVFKKARTYYFVSTNSIRFKCVACKCYITTWIYHFAKQEINI